LVERRYRVLDLFAGAGGFSLGFRRFMNEDGSPFKIVGYVERDPNAARTLVSALVREGMSEDDAKRMVICNDITIPETKRRLYAACPDVDIIIGGPPCQSFSTIGPRSSSPDLKKKFTRDDRDGLFYHYLQIVEHYMPLFFVFENVTGLLTKKHPGSGERYIDRIIGEFERIGYDLRQECEQFPGQRYLLLNAADFGVPQMRERVIMIGNRLNMINPAPSPTHCPSELCGQTGRLPYVTLQDAIGDLSPLLPKITLTPKKKGIPLASVPSSRKKRISVLNTGRNNGSDPAPYRWDRFMDSYNEGWPSRRQFLEFVMPESEDTLLTGHIARGQQESDIQLFRGLKPGTSSKDLLRSSYPADRKLLSLIKYDMNSFLDKYKKLDWGRPCGTVFAHMQKDGNRFIHPDGEQERTLTVREAARIQSFPDNYVFDATGNVRYQLVGNAVPPLMSMAIAHDIFDALCSVTRRQGRGYTIVTDLSVIRKWNMVSMKDHDARPEIVLRKALFLAGLRFRLRERIIGSPDIAFPDKKVAVFVDDCFWHGCPECHQTIAMNDDFWLHKADENRLHDREVDEKLREEGWVVIRIWEHDVLENLSDVVEKIEDTIRNQVPIQEISLGS
jgi:DNA (cytosine-5)-methyltransferase 1